MSASKTNWDVSRRTIFWSLMPIEMHTLVQIDETEHRKRVVSSGVKFSRSAGSRLLEMPWSRLRLDSSNYSEGRRGCNFSSQRIPRCFHCGLRLELWHSLVQADWAIRHPPHPPKIVRVAPNDFEPDLAQRAAATIWESEPKADTEHLCRVVHRRRISSLNEA
jgi:hypothetical protein